MASAAKSRSTPVTPVIEDCWDRLEELLSKHKYMRFSLTSCRTAEEKRWWQAVIFNERGHVLARAGHVSRGIVLEDVLKMMGDKGT